MLSSTIMISTCSDSILLSCLVALTLHMSTKNEIIKYFIFIFLFKIFYFSILDILAKTLQNELTDEGMIWRRCAISFGRRIWGADGAEIWEKSRKTFPKRVYLKCLYYRSKYLLLNFMLNYLLDNLASKRCRSRRFQWRLQCFPLLKKRQVLSIRAYSVFVIWNLNILDCNYNSKALFY